MKNKKLWITLGVIALVVLILISWVVGSYNRFVTLDQDINGKWSEVENQYQRQANLIPNFVSSVSSQVGVETKFVKDVIAARTAWANSAGASQLQKDTLGAKMNSGVQAFVNAVAENYPTLQASEGYTALRDEMAGTQNRITTSRGRYIESIQSYNTATKRFPGNVLARMFGFTQKDYYKAEAGSLTTPDLGTGQLP
jgi:LemA protein